MNRPDPNTAFPVRKPFKPKSRLRSRGWWLKQFHNWHYMSAAVSLMGMLLFAATGITLNHAGSITAKPTVTSQTVTLPAPLLRQLAEPDGSTAPLPAPVADQLERSTGLSTAGKPGEWSDTEVYVALPRPGGDAWLSIDRASGKVSTEVTDRGWISYLNDLHKGRNAGAVWPWFLDVFAAACILFTLTGLVLLYMHSKPRPLTWPLVGLGLLLPFLIAILFIH